jgi:hypothetical protein
MLHGAGDDWIRIVEEAEDLYGKDILTCML